MYKCIWTGCSSFDYEFYTETTRSKSSYLLNIPIDGRKY